MENLLKFDSEMWDSILDMLSSPDGSTRTLGLGFLENIDYTNKDQMGILEETMHLSLAFRQMENIEKGKLVHTYFTLLGKQNEYEHTK
jgi:hypothetical protein